MSLAIFIPKISDFSLKLITSYPITLALNPWVSIRDTSKPIRPPAPIIPTVLPLKRLPSMLLLTHRLCLSS